MKTVLKFVVLGIAILAVTNYIGYQKTGRVPASEWFASLTAAFNKINHKDADKNNIVTVYKWTDVKGVVHYENRPVSNAQVIIDVNTDTNVLPPFPSVAPSASADVKPKVKTADEELRTLQEAKKAHFDALTQ